MWSQNSRRSEATLSQDSRSVLLIWTCCSRTRLIAAWTLSRSACKRSAIATMSLLPWARRRRPQHLRVRQRNAARSQCDAHGRSLLPAWAHQLPVEPCGNDRIDPNALNVESANAVHVTRSEEHTSELQSRGHLVC